MGMGDGGNGGWGGRGDGGVEISHVGVIGRSSLCPHNIDTRHLLPPVRAGRRKVGR